MKSLAWVFWGGLAAVIFGLLWLGVHIPFYLDGVSTQAQVVRLEDVPHRYGKRSLWPPVRPIFEYKVGDKKFTHSGNTTRDVYKIGDRVSILYMPKEPRQSIVLDAHQFWYPPVLLIGGGLFAAFVAMGISYLYRLDWHANREVQHAAEAAEMN